MPKREVELAGHNRDRLTIARGHARPGCERAACRTQIDDNFASPRRRCNKVERRIVVQKRCCQLNAPPIRRRKRTG